MIFIHYFVWNKAMTFISLKSFNCSCTQCVCACTMVYEYRIQCIVQRFFCLFQLFSYVEHLLHPSSIIICEWKDVSDIKRCKLNSTLFHIFQNDQAHTHKKTHRKDKEKSEALVVLFKGAKFEWSVQNSKIVTFWEKFSFFS